MDITDQLNAHVEELYGPEAILQYPTGHENAILATEETGEVEHTAECSECGKRQELRPEQVEEFDKDPMYNCRNRDCCDIDDRKKFKDMIAHDIVRAIMSEQKILDNLEKEFEGEEDPQLSATEWYSYNIEGAYIGAGTPRYVREFVIT